VTEQSQSRAAESEAVEGGVAENAAAETRAAASEPARIRATENGSGRYPDEFYYSIQSGRDFIRRNGLLRQLALGLTALTFPLWGRGYLRMRPAAGSFEFRGKTYPRFFHPYNLTWNNERAVEIPIVWEAVQEHRGRRILEIGNVLAHYFPVDHDILDRYERAPGVLNQDVVAFAPKDRYELIVSVSTLEHVGWDEIPRQPGKFARALESIRGCLREGGIALVTLPLGYNPEVETALRLAEGGFSELYYLKRLDWHRWVEVPSEEMEDVAFNQPYHGANGLAIGIIRR
jgi:hypothetical protein